MSDEDFHKTHICYLGGTDSRYKIVMEGANAGLKPIKKVTYVRNSPSHRRFWVGTHEYDERTRYHQLLEGIKHKNWNGESWERGKFDYIQELGGWELVEGVKRAKGKKTRAKWVYNKRNGKMKALRVVKKCKYWKCSRDSETSRNIFKLCGKCEKIFYCSRKHQKNDWESHKHVCSYY